MELVEDVKDEVLRYLEQHYVNHAPEFIYFKTLYHIFEQFLADQDKGGLLLDNTQIVDSEIWKKLFQLGVDPTLAALSIGYVSIDGCRRQFCKG